MQCPECNHIPLAGTQSDPERCPNCGIYYAKAAWLRKEQVPAGMKSKQQPAPVGGAYDVREALKKYPGAQPVVVIDVQMSFGSMIWFMVKWALASVPALLILMVIGFVAVAVMGGLAGLSR